MTLPTKKKKEPLSAEEASLEIARLSNGNALLKLGVDASVFFPAVERHFRAAIDAEMSLPFFDTTHLYMSDEGFLVVLTVLYGNFRGACQEVSVKSFSEGEYAVLSYQGRIDRDANNAIEALAVSAGLVDTLRTIAKAAGFDLSLSLLDGALEMRFSFVRFRALPISAYSCSEEFVKDKMNRAARLFMQDSAGFFDTL